MLRVLLLLLLFVAGISAMPTIAVEKTIFTGGICQSTFRFRATTPEEIPPLEGVAPFEIANPENVLLFDEHVRRPESFDAARFVLPRWFDGDGSFNLNWHCCSYEKVTWRLGTRTATAFSTCSRVPVQHSYLERPNELGPSPNISVTFLASRTAVVWYPSAAAGSDGCRMPMSNFLSNAVNDDVDVVRRNDDDGAELHCGRDLAIRNQSHAAIVIVANETALAFRSLATHLATRGFIVAVLQHTSRLATMRETALTVALVVTQLRHRFGRNLNDSQLAYIGHDVGADAASAVAELLPKTFSFVAVLAQNVPVLLRGVEEKLFAAGLDDDVRIAAGFDEIVTISFDNSMLPRRLYALGNYYGRTAFTDHCASDLLSIYARLRQQPGHVSNLYDELRQVDCALSPISFTEQTGTSISLLTLELESHFTGSDVSRRLRDTLHVTLGNNVIKRFEVG
jgi:hypothetical protein